MASVNKVILLGNLGRDPETKNFDNGGSVCSFTMATTESYWDKEKAQRVDLPTEWHNIRVTRPGLIKLAQFLRKGSQVYIEGSLRTRKWQDKQSGADRYSTEIVARDMQMLGGRAGTGGGGQSGGERPAATTRSEERTTAPATEAGEFDDDIPF